MKLNSKHRIMLYDPTEEDRKLARKALPELQASYRNTLPILAVICSVSILFTVAAIELFSTMKVFWVLPVLFYFLFVSTLLDCYAAKALYSSVENDSFKVLRGKCRGILNYSKPIAERYEVHGSIPGSDISFIFDIDFEMIKALPKSDWDFMILANNYFDIVVIEGPNNEIFLTRNIHKHYPYVEEV